MAPPLYQPHSLSTNSVADRFSPGMSPELSYTYSIWICRETFSGWAYHFLFTQQLLLWGQSFLYLRHSNPFTTPPGYTSTVRFYWSCFVDMLHIIINSDYCVHKCSSSNRIALTEATDWDIRKKLWWWSRRWSSSSTPSFSATHFRLRLYIVLHQNESGINLHHHHPDSSFVFDL